MINTINSVVNTEFCSNYIMRKFAKQKKKKSSNGNELEGVATAEL